MVAAAGAMASGAHLEDSVRVEDPFTAGGVDEGSWRGTVNCHPASDAGRDGMPDGQIGCAPDLLQSDVPTGAPLPVGQAGAGWAMPFLMLFVSVPT